MKQYKLLFIASLALIGFSCSQQPQKEMPSIEKAFLQKTVTTLASDEMQGRMAGTTTGLRAAEWIAGEMKSMELKPWKADDYLQEFNLSDSVKGYNVVGLLAGKGSLKNEYIILSAHYDHIGIKEAVEGDSIANGADDNATGVAVILGLGKALKQFIAQQTEARSLLIVGFDAEEMGLQGSKRWVEQVFPDKLQPSQVVANLNFEMLGKYPEGGKGRAFITGSDKSTLLAFLQEQTNGYNWNLVADPYPQFGLYNRSDNASFISLGIVAHTLSTDPIDEDKFYHTVADEVETLDFEHTTQVANGILMGLKPLVLGENLP